MREQEFGEAVWLLDRWHVAKRVREFVGADQVAYRQIMAGVYASDREAVVEALRAQAPPVGSVAERPWRDLFGYVLGNREGLDAYAQIPARWRRRNGREGPVVRAGSGAVEKNVEAFLTLDVPGSKWVVGEGPAMPAIRAKYPGVNYLELSVAGL